MAQNRYKLQLLVRIVADILLISDDRYPQVIGNLTKNIFGKLFADKGYSCQTHVILKLKYRMIFIFGYLNDIIFSLSPPRCTPVNKLLPITYIR